MCCFSDEGRKSNKKCLSDFFARSRTKGCSANYALEGFFIHSGCTPLAPVSFPVLVINGDWVEMEWRPTTKSHHGQDSSGEK